jgi:hypothetical protein
MRKRILLLLAVLLTVAHAFFAAWTRQAYDRWAYDTARRVADGHPQLIPYIDVAGYLETVYGQTAIAGAVIVAAIDIIVVALSLRSRAKTAAILTVGIILLSAFSFQSLNPTSLALTAQATVPVVVNTLLFFDQGCTSASDRNYTYSVCFTQRSGQNYRDLGLDPWRKFYSTFNINFTCLNGCNTFWTSNTTDSAELLQEGIQQEGGRRDAANDYWYWHPA